MNLSCYTTSRFIGYIQIQEFASVVLLIGFQISMFDITPSKIFATFSHTLLPERNMKWKAYKLDFQNKLKTLDLLVLEWMIHRSELDRMSHILHNALHQSRDCHWNQPVLNTNVCWNHQDQWDSQNKISLHERMEKCKLCLGLDHPP